MRFELVPLERERLLRLRALALRLLERVLRLRDEPLRDLLRLEEPREEEADLRPERRAREEELFERDDFFEADFLPPRDFFVAAIDILLVVIEHTCQNSGTVCVTSGNPRRVVRERCTFVDQTDANDDRIHDAR